MSKAYAIIQLNEAIKCAFQEVQQIFYILDKESKEEYVVCRYQVLDYVGRDPLLKGYRRGEFKICVTADSIPAMYDDVWKAVKKRFG